MSPDATPRIVFRADASVEIGTGHVMRCLTLAEALRERGAECEFVCRSLPGDRIDEIRRRGFRVHVLTTPEEPPEGREQGPAEPKNQPKLSAAKTQGEPLDYGGWLGGVSPAIDAEQTLQDLRDGLVDWLIVDHYALGRAWEQTLRPAAARIMVIDDLADRPHDSDLLLNQNLGSKPSDYAGIVPPGCELFCGPMFALLRPEFAGLRARSLKNRAGRTLAHILVSMGGVDRDNAAGRVLDAFGAGNFTHGLMVTVVMGGAAPWIEQVHAQVKELSFPVEIAVDVTDMAKRMAVSDFAIGAAGSTSWERCCMGLPGALVTLAENQRNACHELVAAGAAFSLGGYRDIDETLPPVLELLRNEPDKLLRMSRASARICDGLGVQRVATQLLGELE